MSATRSSRYAEGLQLGRRRNCKFLKAGRIHKQRAWERGRVLLVIALRADSNPSETGGSVGEMWISDVSGVCVGWRPGKQAIFKWEATLWLWLCREERREQKKPKAKGCVSANSVHQAQARARIRRSR